MSAPVLVLGGGLAGLFTALKLSPVPTLVVTSGRLGDMAASSWAQGGVAAAVGEGDSAEAHAADTVAAGAGLVDPAVALGMAREAPTRIEDLARFGVPFDREADGRPALSREAAHSRRRIVRVGGDGAGRAIMAALIRGVRATPSITVVEESAAERLVTRGDRVVGAVVRGADGTVRAIPAAAVVLATGGLGGLYAVTTNPPGAVGSGLAMAAEVGARIRDPEFVQFHPTALAVGRDPAPLATEALRGEGARLVDARGRRFMADIHPDGELAPRDVVARAVAGAARDGGALLDARMLGSELAVRFPAVHAACRQAGFDPAETPIPVAPAAHYHMGGVAADERGRTGVPGLWAVGEVASTGVHGANRLASNSLLEAVVFGARAATDIAGGALPAPGPLGVPSAADEPEERELRSAIRRLMTEKVGVVRGEAGLSEAVERLGALRVAARSRHGRAMATTALFVAVAALRRRESRGGHFRCDHPASAATAVSTVLTLDDLPGRAPPARLERIR